MKKIYTLLAQIISWTFNPLVMVGVLLGVVGIKFPGNNHVATAGFLILVFILIILVYGVKKGWFSDFELTLRHERHFLNGIMLLLGAPLFFFVSGNSFSYYAIFYVWLVMFSVITLWWKISGHTGVFTLVFILLNHIFVGMLWWLVILVPILAWSRVVLKKHTLFQVIGGILFSGIIGWGGIALGGL